jgi:pyruvate/2-oxoglutarate dehydrogenase complex dihydrolipoamide acyltransferase (E2) component
MVEKVIMPKLGMMVDDINIVEWFVKEGDEVKEGQELCEIESQKITNRIEAKSQGTVLKIIVKEGDKAPIGAVVAMIGDQGDDIL